MGHNAVWYEDAYPGGVVFIGLENLEPDTQPTLFGFHKIKPNLTTRINSENSG